MRSRKASPALAALAVGGVALAIGGCGDIGGGMTHEDSVKGNGAMRHEQGAAMQDEKGAMHDEGAMHDGGAGAMHGKMDDHDGSMHEG